MSETSSNMRQLVSNMRKTSSKDEEKLIIQMSK